MKQYKISVLLLQGKQLTFTVDKYAISDGDFVEFKDARTNTNKKFHASRCEISEGNAHGSRY